MDWMEDQINQAISLYGDDNNKWNIYENTANDQYYKIIDALKKQKEELTTNAAYWTAKANEDERLIPYRDKAIEALNNIPHFGYDYINYRNKYPKLYSLREELSERFYNRFGRLRIVYNSHVEWQLQLQTIFDNVAYKYENKLLIHERYDTIKEDILNSKIENSATNILYNYPIQQNTEGQENDRKISKNVTTTNANNATLKEKMSNLLTLYDVQLDELEEYLNNFIPLFLTIDKDEIAEYYYV